jgi:hypothetical protein
MAGTVVADTLQAASTSTLVLKNGVANTPPTIQDSAGTQIGTFCRAWVNFNGTGTVAIRADFNVVDITDNGTGDYTINIDVDMPDADYTVVANTGYTAVPAYPLPVALYANNSTGATVAPTAGAARINTRNSGGSQADFAYVTAAIFR